VATTTTSELPDFRDPFLRNAANSLALRRKSISHRGKLTISHDPDDDFEWFSAVYESASRRTAVLQLTEKNRAHLFIRSTRGKDRGRILFRIEDMILVDNAALLLTAFEQTIATLDQQRDDAFDDLRGVWDALRLQAVD
jgi:hypothetical protein